MCQRQSAPQLEASSFQAAPTLTMNSAEGTTVNSREEQFSSKICVPYIANSSREVYREMASVSTLTLLSVEYEYLNAVGSRKPW